MTEDLPKTVAVTVVVMVASTVMAITPAMVTHHNGNLPITVVGQWLMWYVQITNTQS
jgi:hypothetical protein